MVSLVCCLLYYRLCCDSQHCSQVSRFCFAVCFLHLRSQELAEAQIEVVAYHYHLQGLEGQGCEDTLWEEEAIHSREGGAELKAWEEPLDLAETFSE